MARADRRRRGGGGVGRRRAHRLRRERRRGDVRRHRAERRLRLRFALRAPRPRAIRRPLSSGARGNLLEARQDDRSARPRSISFHRDPQEARSPERPALLRESAHLSAVRGAVRSSVRTERHAPLQRSAAGHRRRRRVRVPRGALVRARGDGVHDRLSRRVRASGVRRLSDARDLQLRARVPCVLSVALQRGCAIAATGRRTVRSRGRMPARLRGVLEADPERSADRAADRARVVAAAVALGDSRLRGVSGCDRRVVRLQRVRVGRVQLPGRRSADLLYDLSVRRAGRDLGQPRRRRHHVRVEGAGDVDEPRDAGALRAKPRVLPHRPPLRLRPLLLSRRRGGCVVALVGGAQGRLARADLFRIRRFYAGAPSRAAIHLERRRRPAGQPLFHERVLPAAAADVVHTGDGRVDWRRVVHREDPRRSVLQREVPVHDRGPRVRPPAAGRVDDGQRSADHARRAADAHLVRGRLALLPRHARLYSRGRRRGRHERHLDRRRRPRRHHRAIGVGHRSSNDHGAVADPDDARRLDGRRGIADRARAWQDDDLRPSSSGRSGVGQLFISPLSTID